MKTPTPWGNNDIKNPVTVTPTTKTSSQWANNDVKTPVVYTPRARTPSGFSPEHPSQTYFYDDSKFTYDSVLTLYDTLVNSNTSNQRLLTDWRAN